MVEAVKEGRDIYYDEVFTHVRNSIKELNINKAHGNDLL